MCTSTDRTHWAVASTLALLAFLAPRATGQRIIHEVEGRTDWELGWEAAGAGDTNGDGVPDFLVASSIARNRQGVAVLFSGADATKLHLLKTTGVEGFGYCVSGGRDYDADGISDFLVSSPWEGSNYSGRVYVYSALVHG